MLRVGFIGEGGRARSAHYPTVHRLEGVSVEAVCELNEGLLKRVKDEYKIPRAFTDHREMLDSVELDLVYCVMNERYLLQPAIDCMNAGKHIFIEKPPGLNTSETERMLEVAVENDVYACVGYQRRYAAATVEAMRLVNATGQVTLALGEFNKWLPDGPGGTSTLWNDVCHIVDLVRYMSGGEAVDVHAFHDKWNTDWHNAYHAMIRFDSGAVGVILGNRASGGRTLKSQLHGIGVGCYMELPERMEVLEAGKPPRAFHSAEINEDDPSDEPRYEGVLAMHEHLVECINTRVVPISDLRDVVRTSRLVDRLEAPSR